MKRTPIKRRRAAPRRTTTPRCVKQRCNKRAEIQEMCISHAEQTADDVFSLWVRERDGKCTGMGVLPGACEGHLQAAHTVGRRNHAVRYSTSNVGTLCQRHHVMVDQAGAEHAKFLWATSRLGVTGYSELMLAARPITPRREAVEAALLILTPRQDDPR